MTLRMKVAAYFVALSLVTSAWNSSSAQEEKLALILERSPAPANTIGYVNVGSLHDLMNNAGMKRDVAENVEEFWFIADLNLGSFEPRWEAGYSILKEGIEPEVLAKKVGGYTENIEEKTVVWSPDQSYFVPLEEGRLGVLRPANRSLLTKWINDERSYNSSQYLAARTKPPEDFLSLMLSIELGGHFSPVPMAAKLEGMESLKAVPAKTAASVLASVEGFSVLIGRRGLKGSPHSRL